MGSSSLQRVIFDRVERGLPTNPFRSDPRADTHDTQLLAERLGYPIYCGMLAVLHFDPMLLTTPTIGSISMLGDQTLQPEFAGLAEQVRPDFTLLEFAEEDAIRSAGKETSEISLTH
jgi:hypothetical protein